MLKMIIDNEEVLSDNDISIKEEILSPSSTILNNVYPKSWELDKDYTSRFYYPKDYSKLNIQNFNIEPEEAGKTIQINGSATLTDVDTSKESRVLRILGQTSQNGTPTPSSPIPINVVSGDNYIDICGKNLFNSEVVQGFYTADGNISASNTQIRTTEYMEVEPNTIYTFSNTNNLVIDRICYYNSSKTFIERGVYLNSGTFTTLNNNCKYIRFTIRASDGSNITPSSLVKPMLEKGSTATTYEPHIGNSYPLYLGVEELFDKDNANILNAYFETSTPNLSSNDNARTLYIECSPNTTYTIEKLRSQQFNVGCTSTQPIIGTTIQKIENGTIGVYDGTTKASYTYTTNSTAKYLLVRYAYATQVDLNLMLSSIKIQKGNKINHASTTPIELCKIGTYQDYIYKDNGNWYLHKEIGKVVLDGSETGWGDITQSGGVNRIAITIHTIKGYSDTSRHTGYFICSHFNPNTANAVGNVYQYQTQMIFYPTSDITTKADFVSWLNTNNVDFYYVLTTPTNIEITDTTLLEQLEESKLSYISQTNISQVNNDLPFILDVKALRGE